MENTIENAIAFYLERRSSTLTPFITKSIAQIMVDYHNSVRPEVVVPKQKKVIIYDDDFKQGRRFGFNDYDDELRRLNPTMTFTELNHTAPTGDKSDEG